MDKIAHDGGWKSRKLWFSVLALVIGTTIGFWMPTTALTLVLDFIVTVVAIYTGGATGIKVAAGVADAWKSRGAAPTTPQAPKPAAVPPKGPPPLPVKKASEDDSE